MTVKRAPRLIIPDILRGVAIIAMVLAHAAPMLPEAPGPVKSVVGNISDLASPLFALVMGMSAQLVWNAGPRVGQVLLQQAIRGFVLIALGIWMVRWESWVAIILSFLGVLLIIGVPLLLLPTRWLAIMTGVVVLIGAPLNALARDNAVALSASPVVRHLAEWMLLGHSYRVMNLLPFFLFGALLLRIGLRRNRMMWNMLVIAPLAYLVRPLLERMTGAEFVSGTYVDTLHDVGLVFATYSVIVLVTTQRTLRPVLDAVFVPVRAWGRVALSLYLLHVGVIAVWLRLHGGTWPMTDQWMGWILVVVVPLVIGWLWWRLVGNGPVEWLLGLVSLRPKPLSNRRAPVLSET